MAITDAGDRELISVLEVQEFDQRLSRCMIAFMHATSPTFIAESPQQINNGSIAKILRNDKNLWHEAKIRTSKIRIPEEHFNWTEESPEFLIFFMENLKTQISIIESNPSNETHSNLYATERLAWDGIYFNQNSLFENFKNLLPYMKGKQLIIAIIDILRHDNQTKVKIIENIKFTWNQKLRFDVIFEWFEKKNSRCRYAWDWVIKTHPILAYNDKPFVTADDVKRFFSEAFKNTHEIENKINKIKKNWSQLEYRRKNNEKTQINFMLNNESIRLLKKISKQMDMNTTKALEHLIKNWNNPTEIKKDI